MSVLSCIEICAGAGGQAIGLEKARFDPIVLVDNDLDCCNTLRYNRPNWNVVNADIRQFSATRFNGIDLFAGGVPCPPFSVAGKQLGENDERDLFPEALRLIFECKPRAVMLENVRGFLDVRFDDYRKNLKQQFERLGYLADWRLLNASDFGVSQLRPRVVIVAIQKQFSEHFTWPVIINYDPLSVGDLVYDLMSVKGWKRVNEWRLQANNIAPTIVGGSKKHGGPDLGPTRAKLAWAALGVDATGVADEPPASDFVGMPRLTIPMIARIQGFHDEWRFLGKKTPRFRQIGNAFPPPVAYSVAREIMKCLTHRKTFSLVG